MVASSCCETLVLLALATYRSLTVYEDDNLGALILEKREAESREVTPHLLSCLFGKDFSRFRGMQRVGRRCAFSRYCAFNARMTHFFIKEGYPGHRFWSAF